MTQRSPCCGVVPMAMATALWLSSPNLAAQERFPLRGDFTGHEVVITVSGGGVPGAIIRTNLASAHDVVTLPAISAAGKATFSGSLDIGFPAQTPPAVWLKEGLFGVAFGFEGGLAASVIGRGTWQITPGTPPDAWQNTARLRSATGIDRGALAWDQDVSLRDGVRPGNSIAIDSSDQRSLGNVANLNKVASWDGERVSGFTASEFWTEIGTGGDALARVEVRVKTWYTFTTGEPLKDVVLGTLDKPGCRLTLPRGGTRSFGAQVFQNLVSEDTATLHLEVADLGALEPLYRSEAVPVGFAAPNLVQSGEHPDGQPRFEVFNPLVFVVPPVSLPEHPAVLIFEAVLTGASGRELARVLVGELNVGTSQDEVPTGVTFDPPAGQSFRRRHRASFQADLGVRLESREEAGVRLALYETGMGPTLRTVSTTRTIHPCEEGTPLQLSVSALAEPDDQGFLLRVELVEPGTGALIKVLDEAAYPVRSDLGGGGLLVIRVLEVVGEAELIQEGKESTPIPLRGGEFVRPSDRIYTGLDSHVKLLFADTSTTIIRELTDVKIATFTSSTDAVKTRIWLKAGEVNAQVNHASSVRSDFAIKMPTATCSVRGTVFTVKHVETPVPRSTVTCTEGRVELAAAYPSDRVVLVENGTVEITLDPATGASTLTGDFTPVALPSLTGYDLERFAEVDEPADVVLDADGRVVTVSATWGEVLRFAPDGTASQIASLRPDVGAWRRLALGPEGDIYLSDFLDREVWRVAADGSTQEVFLAGINEPTGLALDPAGNLYVCSHRDGTVVRRSISGAEDWGHGTGVGQGDPLVRDAQGALWIGDALSGSIRQVPAGGGPVQGVISLGRAASGLALQPEETFLVGFPGDPGQGEVAVATRDGAVRRVGRGFTAPTGFARDASGRLYLADRGDDLIYRAIPLPPGTARLVLPSKTVDFGTVQSGSSAERRLVIGNSGTGDLTVTGTTVDHDPQITVTDPPAPFVVVPGEEREVVLRFAPAGAQPHHTWLQLATSDPGQPLVAVTLLGLGVVPEIVSGPSELQPGATATFHGRYFAESPELNAASLGAWELTVISASTTELSVMVPPGMPSGPWDLRIAVAGWSSAPFGVYVVPPGGEPLLEFAPLVLRFGNVTLGESKDLDFTLMNSGQAGLVVDRLDFDQPGFSVAAPALPLRIGPGTEVAVTVRYAPELPASPFTAHATFVSNDPNETMLELTGRGVLPPAPVITSVTPDRGPSGTEVLIAGQNLGRRPEDVTVRFDDLPAAALEVQPTFIRTVVPAGVRLGQVDLRITVYIPERMAGASFQVLGGVATEPPVITSALTARATQGLPFSYGIQAAHDPSSFGATGLPPGLEVNPQNGVITGQPGRRGTFLVVLSASNALGTATATLILRVGQTADDLIAWYPLDGTGADLGGHGLHGRVVGGVTPAPDRAGIAGGACGLDGATGFIDLGPSPLLKPGAGITVAAWVYRPSWSAIPARQAVLDNTGPGQGWGLWCVSSPAVEGRAGREAEGFGSPIPAWGTASMADGWHHLALTCDGQDTTLYVNGMLASRQWGPAVRPLAYDDDNHTLVGALAGVTAGGGPGPDGGFFAGRLDDLVIYARALTGPELATVRTGVTLPSGFEAWRRARFGADAANPATGGDTGDPDGDRRPNLLEYFLGTDPLGRDTTGPDLTALRGAGPAEVDFAFTHQAAAAEVAVVIESSTDLAAWSPVATRSPGMGWVQAAPGIRVTETDAGPGTTVVVSCGPVSGEPAPLFVRYRLVR